MHRRAVLTALLALPALAACHEKPMLGQQKPAMDPKRLQKEVDAIAKRVAPTTLGAAAEDLGTRQLWSYDGDRAFPLGAGARVPVLAATMAETAAGRLPLSETLPVRDVDLSPPPSTVADAWPGRQAYTVEELETLALKGDATALDLLTARIGGPGAVNGWLGVKGLAGISVDRYRRQALTEDHGMASFRADWKGQEAWRRALGSVPATDRVRAETKRRTDPRDAATPVGMVRLLEAFESGEAFPHPNAARLLGRDSGYLAAVLPKGASLAQAADSATPDLSVISSTHAIGVVTLEDGRKVALTVFLGASTLDLATRERIVGDVARTILKEF